MKYFFKHLPMLFSICFLFIGVQAYSNTVLGGDLPPTTIENDITNCVGVNIAYWSLNGCTAGFDYSEFTAVTSTPSGFSDVSASLVTHSGAHSCVLGESGQGMCAQIRDNCSWTDNSNMAFRFSVTLSPSTGSVINLTELSFYEAAPNNLNAGDNDPPSYYGMRVLKDGQEVYQNTGINTTPSWSLEQFDFSNDPDFEVSSTTTFEFEMLAYCRNGTGGLAVWDLDEIKVSACASTPPNPCQGQGGDSDGDGICNNQDCQPFNPAFPATPGTACNDGNPNTTNDVITTDGCNCAGTIIDPCQGQGGDSDNDGICNNQDCQPFNPAFPATPGTACNDGNPNTTNDVITTDGCNCAGTPVGPTCSVTTGNCSITVSGAGSEVKVFNSNWNIVYHCSQWNGGCNSTESITDLENGTYYVQACGQTETVSISGCTSTGPCDNQGGDSDNDGTCNNQDCQPNNPAFPATPGSSCNDGNSNTTNDVVTADGCGCAGTPVGPTCNVTTGNCSITVTGAGSEVKVFNSNWSIVYHCNQWNGGCNSTETITNLENGTYFIQACGQTETVSVSGCAPANPSLFIGDTSVDESAGTATVTLTASAPSTTPITVTYTTNNGSAIGGSDYTPTTATATIPAGQTSTTISIPIIDDNNPEPTESFTIVLSNPNGATVADNSGTVTITDTDQTGPTCNVTTGNCSITVTGAGSEVKVFNASWGIVYHCNQWNGGCNSTETITNLENGTYYVQACGQTEAVSVSGCAPANPSLFIGDTSVDESAGTATVTLTASAPSTTPITVTYTTNNGSAIGGADYTPTTATATIPAGQTSTTISIPIIDDNNPEPTESFTIVLSNPNGATVADNSGTVTITDTDQTGPTCNVTTGNCSITVTGAGSEVKVFNSSWGIVYHCNQWNGGCNSTETITNLENGSYYVQACGQTETVSVSGCAPANPSLFIGDTSVDESAGTATVTLTASAPSTTPITVTYTTNNGSAIGGADYTPTTATATIPAGQTSTTISIPIIDDNNPEPTESFTIVLSNPNGATVADNSGTVTITDTDQTGPTCNVTTGNCSITVTGAGSEVKVFNSSWGIVYHCNQWNGGCNSTETITNLENGTYYVQACGQTETVSVSGCAPANPSLFIGDTSVDESAGTATVTLTASAPSTTPITVTYTTNNGSAIGGADYTPTTATATIPAGQTSTTITIPIVDDNNPEPTESFTIVLSNPNGATVADNSGTVTITDTDQTGPTCNVTTGNCSITVTGAGSEVKVFNSSWGIVYHCNQWNGGCNSTETITNLENGTYYVQACGQTETVSVSGCAPANPSLFIGDTSVDESAGTATVTVNASGPSTMPITVTYTTNNGSAIGGADYTPTTATATIPAGQTSTTITIPIVDDNNPEPTESFTIVLSNPNGATVADNSGTVTITDTDQTDPCDTQGGDTDGDGVCNNQDCQPFNPAFPATPGTACNDGDSNTENDVITSDGCDCAGTPVQGCNPTNLAYWDLQGCFDGLPAATNVPAGFSIVNASEFDGNDYSCAPGASGQAICTGIRDACSWVDNNAAAVRFSITVKPNNGGTASLTKLSFYELSPETFILNNGFTGENDPPAYYGIRVLKNGQEIYQKTGRNTTNNWSYEEFNLSNDPDFVFTSQTTFEFELLGYCRQGSPIINPDIQDFGTAIWDLDEVKIEGCAGNAYDPLTSSSDESLYFTALKDGRDVALSWTTNTDYKNDYFEVEHSTDGDNFMLLEEVLSISDSESYMNYSNKDYTPINGINYYRLKQVFNDGSYRYSTVREVAFNLDVNKFTVYPNPTSNEVFVNLKDFVGNEGTIQIHNSLGQTVYTQHLDIIPDHPVMISVADMGVGVHAVTVQLEDKKVMTEMLIISKL